MAIKKKNRPKSLTGGTFNVRYGRPDKKVKGEVERLLQKHDLDFLCLQEAYNYTNEFRHIDGYDYIFNLATWAGKEATILVKSELNTGKERFFVYGDGWTTEKGRHHPANGMSQVRVADWLIVRSLHLPTPSHWSGGKISSSVPKERKDDLVAAMKGLRGFFRWPSTRWARVAAGDWNEPHWTEGEFSPEWLKNKTKATAASPSSKVGHGRIDWPMVKGCRIAWIVKDLEFAEGSDHEPVIFKLVKN